MQTVTLTSAAKVQLLIILTAAQRNTIRLGLVSRGCTGYEYVLELDNVSLLGEDIEIEIDNGKFLLIDPLSFSKLHNTEIDYVKESVNEYFVFTNPSVKETCGCGKSVLF